MCSRRVRRTPCPFKLYKRLLTTANTKVILSCVIHHCSTPPQECHFQGSNLRNGTAWLRKLWNKLDSKASRKLAMPSPGDVGFPLVINRKTERHGFTGSKCRYYRSLTWAFSGSTAPSHFGAPNGLRTMLIYNLHNLSIS